MTDFWAMIFNNIAKLSIVQNHYIQKYNFRYEVESDGWLVIYSGDQWVHAGSRETEWKHIVGMLGLSNNLVVQKLLA